MQINVRKIHGGLIRCRNTSQMQDILQLPGKRTLLDTYSCIFLEYLPLATGSSRRDAELTQRQQCLEKDPPPRSTAPEMTVKSEYPVMW